MPIRRLGNITYKVLAILLVAYGLGYGLTASLPELPLLAQSSRIMFFHVPMWFAVIALMAISLFWSLSFLRQSDPDRVASPQPLQSDLKAAEAARIGVVFNILGLLTGMIWARVTWGEDQPWTDLSAWWVWDPIQISALVALLIYLAYFLLRSAFAEPNQKARAAAVYNIFAFAALIPLFFIIPKSMEGLHPTAAKGSFIFDKSQIDNSYRMILYPTMLGIILLGIWIYELRSRMALLQRRLLNLEQEAPPVSEVMTGDLSTN